MRLRAGERLVPGESSEGPQSDLMARYLAGEEVSEQLRQLEQAEPQAPARLEADRPAPTPAEKPAERPTLAVIAVVIALGVFAISVWIALR